MSVFSLSIVLAQLIEWHHGAICLMPPAAKVQSVGVLVASAGVALVLASSRVLLRYGNVTDCFG
jgi:hypothetical protein